MTLTQLAVLLFLVFAIPGACLLVMIGCFIRGLYTGWRQSRMYARARQYDLDLRARRVS